MPSSTFFRLPSEKRETLLRCARAEFARVPYADASINRIIHAAGIPRGSFYMYFTDKSDLFSHLMGQYTQKFADLTAEILAAREGDLFAAFLDLYDRLQSDYRPQCRDGMLEELLSILHHNAGLPSLMAQGEANARQAVALILSRMDATPLLLLREGDAEEILHIVLTVTIPLLCQGILAEDPAPIRERYVNLLEILKRGMAKTPAAAEPYS